VADADPLQAIEDTVRDEKFDEIILSAPSKRSGWMTPNLPRKIQTAVGLDATYVPGERESAVRETALMRTPLLGRLPERKLRAVAKYSMIHSYREGTTIVEEDAENSDLYVILDGRVSVTIGGKAVDHLSVGEFFGEISLLSSGWATATVTAEAPTRCLSLSGNDLRAAMAKDAKLAEMIVEAAGARMLEIRRSLRDAMQGLVLEGELLEWLSESVHVQYCADQLAKGMTWGEPTDEYLRGHESLAAYAGRKRDPKRTAPNLIAYENLSEQVKEQSRDLVREIPKKLAAAGYVMGRLAAGESPSAPSEEEIESLAEREHDRWVRLKLAQGWSFAPARDEGARAHPSLVPWRELKKEERQGRYGLEGASRLGPGVLSEEEKDKDRALMRNIGSILAQAGFTAAKVERSVN
jgi:CRP-like cAMP-binding protein